VARDDRNEDNVEQTEGVVVHPSSEAAQRNGRFRLVIGNREAENRGEVPLLLVGWPDVKNGDRGERCDHVDPKRQVPADWNRSAAADGSIVVSLRHTYRESRQGR